MFSKSIKFFATLGFAAMMVVSSANALEIGDSVPDIRLNLNDGRQIELKEFRGKIVYLDFWASWCPPCRQSLPFMSMLGTQYSKNDLEIIAINLDIEVAAAKKALDGIEQNFHIGMDPEGITPSIFEPKAMPTSYLIDKEGKVISIFVGFRAEEKDEIKKVISNLVDS